jgi:methionyl-tRNA formyltransferase
LKIAYFGLPLGALLLAEDGHAPALVVLSPVEAPGRRRLSGRVPLLLDALEEEEAALDVRVSQALATLQPDLLVSWFWTRKLPASWLELPRWGAIGVHPSLLPRHRGPNPYFWSIDAGDEETGVTLHRLSSEYDTGAILDARSLPVGGRNAWQLARALDRPSLALLRAGVARFAEGDIPAEREQDEARATWAPEPSGEALRVDFGWTTERVLRRIRALSPTPGLGLEVEGVELFVTGAAPVPNFIAALLPGEAHISDALSLRTSDGAIQATRAYFPDTETEAVSAPAVVAELSARRGRP